MEEDEQDGEEERMQAGGMTRKEENEEGSENARSRTVAIQQ